MDINQVGLFRANPEASNFNNINLVDGATPGTPLEDSGDVDTIASTEFTGIKYTNKEDVTVTLMFGKIIHKTHQRIAEPVKVAAGRDALRDAILEVTEQHEVRPIVKVTGAAATYSIEHIGSGTVTAIIMDEADQALSRGVIGAEIQFQAKQVKAKAKTAKVEA